MAEETHGSHPPIRSSRHSDVALYGVYEISKLLTTPGRLEVILGKVLQLLSSFLDMRHGLIALLGEDGRPEIVVGSYWSEATAKRYFEQLPGRAIGQIIVTQMPLVVPEMKDDALFEHWDFAAWGESDANLAFVGVPIKDRGRVIGTLTIDRKQSAERYHRLDEDVRFLAMIANLLGQTVRLHRLVTADRERLLEAQHRLQKVVDHTTPATASSQEGIIGSSSAMRAVLEKVRIVAKSHSTVLLRGESGTGKELFARALHDWSPRKARALVGVNCAALSESVLESELFGHEKGAFTGAAGVRKGRFELADGGTLFLDEIGEISPAFQAKLLRVLQEGEFERVGGSTTLKVNVRLIAATNRNLEEAVARGDFRADLYYRISVIPIFLPPLRERREDIPVLAKEFLRRFNDEHGSSLTLSRDALQVLLGCVFPGNVRELENCVRRTATLAAGTSIVGNDFACRHDECMSALLWKSPATRDHVSLPIAPPSHAPHSPPSGEAQAGPISSASPESAHAALDEGDVLDPESDCDDRRRLIETMEAVGWVQAKAARRLGITPRQISYALRKHEIAIKKF
jgi:Nif-specific regulatory protein